MEFISNPQAIEDLSMTIIEESLPELFNLPLEERQIIKRVVHTTGDTSYAGLLRIRSGAAAAGVAALRAGCNIVTDVNMVKAGINRHRLTTLGIKVSVILVTRK
nr:precorrin-8X methylmutase [Desulfolucanica intricata]